MSHDFATEQLGLLRRTFYQGVPAKQFFQERNLLLQAIAYTAARMKERYSVSADDVLRTLILKTVIETIVRKGNRAKIKRFSVYFLHCVQEHMKHHGSEYYDLAKAARSAADALPAVLGQVRIGQAARDTEILAGIYAALKSRGGRKKRAPKSQLELI